MKQILKKVIKYFFNLLGFNIIRITSTHKPENNDTDFYTLLYPEESLKKKYFYNIGAGNFLHKYWTNVDIISEFYGRSSHNIDIDYDLMKLAPLPLPDNHAEIVYISHVLANITDEAVLNIFSECYRILKPNGILRIVEADIDIYYNAYKRNDYIVFSKYPKTEEQKLWEQNWFNVDANVLQNATLEERFLLYRFRQLSPIAPIDHQKISSEEFRKLLSEKTPMDVFTYFSSLCSFDVKHPEYHINFFNLEKATQFLHKAGFKKVLSSAYGQSIAPVLRDTDFFDTTVPSVSFYCEAIK